MTKTAETTERKGSDIMARNRSQQREINCLRSVDFVPIETRADDDGTDDGSTLYGYAAVFDVDTLINSWEGCFYERMVMGTFRKTLKERTPVLQFDHGYDQRTGTVPIGVYTVIEEQEGKGLYVEADLFDNDVVKPIRQAIARKAISGMSFRFSVVRDEWRDKDGKKIKPEDLWERLWISSEEDPLYRTIKEVKLSEAGPVVFPAYNTTSVGVRSELPDDLASLPEEERHKILTETYVRTASRHTPTVPTDAEPLGLTSETPSEDTEVPVSTEDEGTTTDAVHEDTSIGHEEVAKRAIPQRVVPARRIPTRIERK